jgi:hypothetical protein
MSRIAMTWPIPVAERSKAKICASSLAWISGSNPAGRTDVCLFRVLCYQVEVSATGRSLVQRSPTDCDVSFFCDLETSTMRRSWPALGCCARETDSNDIAGDV